MSADRIRRTALRDHERCIMLKYGFTIRSREGQKINGITIMGRDQAEAERKLRQMYRQSEILQCDLQHEEERHRATISVESLPSLISKAH